MVAKILISRRFKKGKKKDSLEMLMKSMGGKFDGFISPKNIDLNLVEGLLRKGWGEPECGQFLKVALDFSKESEEERYIVLFAQLLEAFEREYRDEE